MTRLLILALSVVLSGCALGAAAPGYVKCKGKGVITGSGSAGGGMLYGGGGLNAFTLSVDCGDGLEFQQGVPSGNASVSAPPK